MTKSSRKSLSKSTISASKTVSGFAKKSAKSEQQSASASVIGASEHSKSTKGVAVKSIAGGNSSSSSSNSYEASNVKGRPKLCKQIAKVFSTKGAIELNSAKELKSRHYELKDSVPDQDGLKRAVGPNEKNIICKIIELKSCTPRYKVTMECYSLKIMRFIGRKPLLKSFPKIYDIFLAEKVYYIFMSDCGCKSLYDVVLSGEHLSPGRIRGWVRSLTEAVCEMQKYGIAHRFIKLKHILIEQQHHSDHHSLKIVGWSKSVLFYDIKRKKALYQHRERRARKNNFLPPEAFHRLYDPSKADIWAVGVILISLTTGRYPFHVRAHLKFSSQWRRFVKQHPLNPIVRSLANKIFVIDSKRRIHAADMLKQSYFRVEEKQLVSKSVRGKPLHDGARTAAAKSVHAAKSPKAALVQTKSSSFASHAKSAVAKSHKHSSSSSSAFPSSVVKSAKSSPVSSSNKSGHTASSKLQSLSKSGYSSGSALASGRHSRTSKLSNASIGASIKGITSKSVTTSKSSTSNKKVTSKIKPKSSKRKSAKHKKSAKKKSRSSKPSKHKSNQVAENSTKSGKSEKDKPSKTKSKSSSSKSKKSKSATSSKPKSAKVKSSKITSAKSTGPMSLAVKSSKAGKSEISSKTKKASKSTDDTASKKTTLPTENGKIVEKAERKSNCNLDGVSKQEIEAETDDAQAESDQAKEEEAEPEMDEVVKEDGEADGEGKVAPDGGVDVEGVADEQEMQAPEETKEQATPEEMEAVEGQGEDVNAGAAHELISEAAEGAAEEEGQAKGEESAAAAASGENGAEPSKASDPPAK